MIRSTLTALCLLMVAGCSMNREKPQTIDLALLKPCPPIPMIPTQDDGRIQMGELTLSDTELVGMYAECAVGKLGLIKAVEGMTDE